MSRTSLNMMFREASRVRIDPRNDAGTSLIYGPYSKTICQEPSILSEDSFQKPKGGERREKENVKCLFI